MPPSGTRPEASEGNPTQVDPGAPPFQWGLLAWAALVGISTGLAVVAFHELLGFINNFLFGPFVEGLLVIGRSSPATPADLPPIDLPPLAPDSGTPLRALLQLGPTALHRSSFLRKLLASQSSSNQPS